MAVTATAIAVTGDATVALAQLLLLVCDTPREEMGCEGKDGSDSASSDSPASCIMGCCCSCSASEEE